MKADYYKIKNQKNICLVGKCEKTRRVNSHLCDDHWFTSGEFPK